MLTSTGEVRPLEEMETEIIRFAISHYRGQMSEVARRLKIGRSTLYRKLDEAAANDPSSGGHGDAELGRSPIAALNGVIRNRLNTAGRPGTFEPLLAGDRQTADARGKSAHSVAKRILKSVCRELPRAALAA